MDITEVARGEVCANSQNEAAASYYYYYYYYIVYFVVVVVVQQRCNYAYIRRKKNKIRQYCVFRSLEEKKENARSSVGRQQGKAIISRRVAWGTAGGRRLVDF